METPSFEGKKVEQAPTFDLSVVLQECNACNIHLMELHMEHPFARVVEEDFLSQEPESPSSGTVFLPVPESGGEEDRAGREVLQKKEEMFAMLHKRFDADLKEIGLRLTENTEMYWYGDIQISLSDPHKLLSYLEQIGEGVAASSQVLGVKELLSQFLGTIMYGGSGEANGDTGMLNTEQNDLVVDLFSVKDRLEIVCRKLDSDNAQGLKGIAENFKVLFEAAKQRYLREYLIAEQRNLLIAPGEQFSLANFHEGVLNAHLFSPPDAEMNDEEIIKDAFSRYESTWDDVLNAVRDIKKNKYAGQLYKDVLTNLRLVLDYAEKDLLARSGEFSKEEIKSKLLIVVQKTRTILEELEREEA